MRSSGSVTDRPWGLTLAELGLGSFTGLLTVVADGKEYSISFDLGRVVAATSPLASDAAVRVALTNHLVSSSQVGEINRKIAAARDRDELEVLAELAQLGPEHVDKLRHKLVAQRAARTFSLEQGTYSGEEKIAMPAGASIDVREVIYLGARMNLAEQRLGAALRNFGVVFVIKPEAIPTLDQYGFTTDEDPVVHRLLQGATLPELEAAHRDIDPRMIQAILYALMSCGACHAQRTPVAGASVVEYASGPELTPRTNTTDTAYFVSRTQTAPVAARPPSYPGTLELDDPPLTFEPAIARTATGSSAVPAPGAFEARTRATTAEPAVARTTTPVSTRAPTAEPVVARTTTPTAARAPRSSTEGVRGPAAPPIDDGVPRIPPRRSPTDTPAIGRPVTADPPNVARAATTDPRRSPTGAPPNVARAATSNPSRAPSDDPGRPRPDTIDPGGTVEVIGPRLDLSDGTGFRGGDPPPPRTTTPRPGAGSSSVRAPGQPTIPRGGRSGTVQPTMPRTGSPELAPSRTPISDAAPGEPGASEPYGSGPSASGTGAHAATGRTASASTAPATSRAGTASTAPATARTGTGPVVSRTGTGPVVSRTGTGPVVSRTGTGPVVSRTGTGPVVSRTGTGPAASRTATGSPTPARTTTGQPATGRAGTSDPAVARTKSGRPVGPAVARTSTARKAQALIAARMILVEQNADYFTLLGVPFDAPIDVVQTTYLNLVRQLHPDKLEELGVPDANGQAQRLFHQIGVAFSVLTDPLRRSEYMQKVARPPDATSRTRTADDIPAGPAGDAYRRGESALRRDIPADAVVEFGRACALDPNNVDFHAMLGWAQFCAASDKTTIAPETRKALDRAILKSTKPVQARFLLGRVERMLGRDKEALRHFQEVLEATPNHPEASAEIRAIEARLARASKR